MNPGQEEEKPVIAQRPNEREMKQLGEAVSGAMKAVKPRLLIRRWKLL